MPLIKKCEICNKRFQTKLSYVVNGQGRFCSVKCRGISLRKGKEIKCFLCGKLSYKSKVNLSRSKSGKFFCSKSCQTKWRNQEFIGPKHANWNGGRSSYKSVLSRNKVSKVCKLCGNNDERVMAVHHLDKNRYNNNIENLVWLCHNCHHLVHHYKEGRDKLMAVLV
ncbi:MAG: hypothetical protein KAS02_00015 [Candidatus Pacebacteria bacterium]|nr:hypothetical protein [Candidatus Paceibacterota bacterium]